MNLLLLLSAFLSALTGIGGRVSTPDVAQAVVGASIARPASASARVRAARRPVAALPILAEVARRTVAVQARVLAAPLWMDRRRE